MRTKLSDKIRKLIPILALFGLTVFFNSKIAVAEDLTKIPIFFVHGRGMSSNCWNNLIRYLVKNGYPENYLGKIQLIPNDGPNIEAAEKQIAPAIEEFLNKINALRKSQTSTHHHLIKIDLISHSMGALSSRWYAAKIRPDRVRKWISIGGANHGSNEACRFRSPGARDSCPAYAKNKEESYIQYILNGDPYESDVDETPYGIGKDSPGVNTIAAENIRRIIYITIRTFPDRFIKPEESAILDGAGGVNIPISNGLPVKETSPGNYLMTNRVGHDEMLSDKDTMKLVKIILNHGNKF